MVYVLFLGMSVTVLIAAVVSGRKHPVNKDEMSLFNYIGE